MKIHKNISHFYRTIIQSVLHMRSQTCHEADGICFRAPHLYKPFQGPENSPRMCLYGQLFLLHLEIYL